MAKNEVSDSGNTGLSVPKGAVLHQQRRVLKNKKTGEIKEFYSVDARDAVNSGMWVTTDMKTRPTAADKIAPRLEPKRIVDDEPPPPPPAAPARDTQKLTRAEDEDEVEELPEAEDEREPEPEPEDDDAWAAWTDDELRAAAAELGHQHAGPGGDNRVGLIEFIESKGGEPDDERPKAKAEKKGKKKKK